MLRQNGAHASPAPSSPNLPKEVAETTRARFSFPDAQKEHRREGKGFYIPLGLRILLNTPTRPPSRGMGDTASAVYTAESFRVTVRPPGVLCVTGATRCWLAALGVPLRRELKPATRVQRSEVSQRLAF